MGECKQRYEWDCFLASITMAVDGDYDKLWVENIPYDPRFPGIGASSFVECMICNHGIFDRHIDLAFNRAGLYSNVDYWFVGVPSPVLQSAKYLLRGRRAILQVPSLNYEGGAHIVYWDGERVFDPSPKQQYHWLQSMLIENVWLLSSAGV